MRPPLFGTARSGGIQVSVGVIGSFPIAVREQLFSEVWTRDLNTALTMARKIESGHIWINGVSGHFKGMPFT